MSAAETEFSEGPIFEIFENLLFEQNIVHVLKKNTENVHTDKELYFDVAWHYLIHFQAISASFPQFPQTSISFYQYKSFN